MSNSFHKWYHQAVPLCAVCLFLFSTVVSPFVQLESPQQFRTVDELVSDDGFACVGYFQQSTQDSKKSEGYAKVEIGVVPSAEGPLLEEWQAHRLPNSTFYSSRLLYTQITSSYL